MPRRLPKQQGAGSKPAVAGHAPGGDLVNLDRRAESPVKAPAVKGRNRLDLSAQESAQTHAAPVPAPAPSSTPTQGHQQAVSAAAGGLHSTSKSLGGRDARANLGAATRSPLDLLLPYQRDWVADQSRFKIGLWARQTGKSFTTAGESVTDSMQRKTTWVTLSAGERQALEWMRKAREWAEAYKYVIEDYAEDRDSAQSILKAAEITWQNGSRLIAIPANPDTARGYSANLTLDEFAFHEQPDRIWRAIYPSISNPLKGIYKIRIVSTPNGLGNKFHDLWAKPNDWSKHKVDIHTAVARGLPLNIEQIRAGLDDAEGWAQEYECQFIDAAAVLLPYEVIAKCESAEATAAVPFEFWLASPGRRLVCGIDFARKRNLTVCYTAEILGDVLHTVEVLELHNMDTPSQIGEIRPRLQAASRACLDYTGPGVGFGDYLVKEFGEWKPDQHVYGKVELCNFTNPFKVDIFSKLRMAFDGIKLRVPVNRALREDLHSMQRVVSPQGTVTYRAPHTDDGHADRCTALALCLRAGSFGTAGAFNGETVEKVVWQGKGRHAAARLPLLRPLPAEAMQL